eukprot:6173327-Pleurochrysis_carterae.AAC.1
MLACFADSASAVASTRMWFYLSLKAQTVSCEYLLFVLRTEVISTWNFGMWAATISNLAKVVRENAPCRSNTEERNANFHAVTCRNLLHVRDHQIAWHTETHAVRIKTWPRQYVNIIIIIIILHQDSI